MASPAPSSSRRLLLIAILLFFIGMLLAAVTIYLVTSPPGSNQQARPSAIGGPFSLVNQDQVRVTEKDLLGRPTVIFFGFTHCPDICPTALYELTQIFEALGPDVAKVNAYFITVDPERDTPEQMKLYLSSFHPRLNALSGTPEEIRAVMKAYRAYAQKVPLDKGGYTMDHTAAAYLMNKNGEFAQVFDLKKDPKEAAKVLRSYF